MSLKNILLLTAGPCGVNLTRSAERNDLIDKINEAAEELYNSTDLVFSLREQVFDIHDKQLTLPYYVGNLRAVRRYNTGEKIVLKDMRPRYFFGEWAKKDQCHWRIKHSSKVCCDFVNASPITYYIPAAETEDIEVVTVGSTLTAEKLEETVIIKAGDTSAVTVNSWTEHPGLVGVSKNRITKYNVGGRNASMQVVTEIPNSELDANYTIVHVRDNETNSCPCECFEILYKFKFTRLYNDYDELPAPGYDAAVAWMVRSNYEATREGGEIRAVGFAQKSRDLVKQREEDAHRGISMEIQAAPHRTYRAIDSITHYGYDSTPYSYYVSGIHQV
ncbi:MAG TPA: hypothetical protein VL854_05715 [Nitrososphaeraceae archaeon]|nr:hypothetical protein [Nitrososphaeraceae archaeon]